MLKKKVYMALIQEWKVIIMLEDLLGIVKTYYIINLITIKTYSKDKLENINKIIKTTIQIQAEEGNINISLMAMNSNILEEME